MNVDFINPFVLSVFDCFRTMLEADIVRGDPCLYSGDPTELMTQITALIGMSGPISGTVALGFSEKTARTVVGRLLNDPPSLDDDLMLDGVAELVNIIAGGAKSRLAGAETEPISLGLPSVVRGEDYTVRYPSGAQWLEIPFVTSHGNVTLRVTFRLEGAKRGPASYQANKT